MEEAVKPFGSSFIPDQILSMLPDLSPIKQRDRLAMREAAPKAAPADAGHFVKAQRNGFANQADPDISSMINTLNARLQTMDTQKLLLPLPRRDAPFAKAQSIGSALESGIARAEEAEAPKARELAREDSASSGSHISEYFDYNEGCYEVPLDAQCASASGASNQPAVDLGQYSTPALQEAGTSAQRGGFYEAIYVQPRHNSHFPEPGTAQGSLNDRLRQIQALMQRSSQNSAISQPDEPPVPAAPAIAALMSDSPSFRQGSDVLAPQQHNITKMAEELQIYRTEVRRKEPVYEPQPTPLTARLDNIRKKIRSMDGVRKRDDGLLAPRTLPIESQQHRVYEAPETAEDEAIEAPDDIVEVESYYVSSSSNVRNSSDLVAENDEQNKRSRLENVFYSGAQPAAGRLQNPVRTAVASSPRDQETSLQVSDLRDQEERSLPSGSRKDQPKDQPTKNTQVAAAVHGNQNQRFFQPLQTLRQQYEMSRIQALRASDHYEQCEERFLTSVRRFQQKMSANRGRCCTPNQRAERIKQLMRE